MNRDDIIRMVRESKVCYICNVNPASQTVLEGLEAFANLVAAAEREACTRVYEEMRAEHEMCARVNEEVRNDALWEFRS